MAEWWDRINDELGRRGWNAAEFGRRLGLPDERDRQSLYKHLAGAVANPRGDTLERYARLLGVHEFWLRSGTGPRLSEVPVVGYVSGGEEFLPIDDYERGAGYDTVDLGLDSAVDPIAVRVRGSSMSPVYRSGDSLLCSRVRGANIENALGKDCVVMTTAGAGYVKQVRRARDGSYILRSYNPAYADIEDAQIEWVAPIVIIRRAP